MYIQLFFTHNYHDNPKFEKKQELCRLLVANNSVEIALELFLSQKVLYGRLLQHDTTFPQNLTLFCALSVQSQNHGS